MADAWNLQLFGKVGNAPIPLSDGPSASTSVSRSASTSASSLSLIRGGLPTSARTSSTTRTSPRVDATSATLLGAFVMDDDAEAVADGAYGSSSRRRQQFRRDAPFQSPPHMRSSSLPVSIGMSPPRAIQYGRGSSGYRGGASPRSLGGGGGAVAPRGRAATEQRLPRGFAATPPPSRADPTALFEPQRESFSTRMAAMRLREAEKVRALAQDAERVRVAAHKKALAKQKRLSALGLVDDAGNAILHSIVIPRKSAHQQHMQGLQGVPMHQRITPSGHGSSNSETRGTTGGGGGEERSEDGTAGGCDLRSRHRSGSSRRGSLRSRTSGDSEGSAQSQKSALRRSLGGRDSGSAGDGSSSPTPSRRRSSVGSEGLDVHAPAPRSRAGTAASSESELSRNVSHVSQKSLVASVGGLIGSLGGLGLGLRRKERERGRWFGDGGGGGGGGGDGDDLESRTPPSLPPSMGESGGSLQIVDIDLRGLQQSRSPSPRLGGERHVGDRRSGGFGGRGGERERERRRLEERQRREEDAESLPPPLHHTLLAGFDDDDGALIGDAALFGDGDDAIGFAGGGDDELCFDLEL